MKKKIYAHIIAMFIVLGLSYVGYFGFPKFFGNFENKLNDIMFIFRGEKKADQNVIIIDIDEKSLKELGQWPWSRDKVAKILQNLAEYGVGIVGLDVVFAEKDKSSPKLVLKKLGMDYKNAPDYDEVLSQTIANTPTIVGYVFILNNDGIKPTRSPKNSAIFIERNKPPKKFVITPYRAVLNIPPIQKAAYSNGYFNTIPDSDGIVRSIPMIMRYNDMLYPSLTLEMFRVIMQTNKVYVNYSENGVESITIANITIPTDRYGRMLVNFRGEAKRYKYISASDIYFKRVKRSDIEGKVAFLGTSAAGLLDLRSIPFDNVYPGVEVHATAMDNLINQNFISRPSWVIGADVIDIFAALLVIFFILFIPNAFLSFLMLLVLNGVIFYFHYYMMFQKGILLNTIFPLVGINVLYLIGNIINYFFETRQKEKIKKKFAAKVSPAVVEQLIKNPDNDILEVKEEVITIFFSDIRSFTTISEKMGSAKELIKLLNEYMTPMVNIITEHKGTVDKFIGDAIMAYWNAPLKVKNHADEALKASIEQIRTLKDLNKKLKEQNRPVIDIGIGLNSGLSVVGEMGSIGRSDYTCIGDPVNLASRAEGLCKPYGAKIVLSEFTKSLLVQNDYLIRELDIVKVKGKSKPVAVFECYGDKDGGWVEFDDEDEKAYKEAVELYRDSKFKEAKDIFLKLSAKSKQKLYELYIQRCDYFIENPPVDFDGVFTFTTK